MSTQPNWVIDLVNAVDEYEEIHGNHREGWPCLSTVREGIPKDVLNQARGVAEYQRQQPELAKERRPHCDECQKWDENYYCVICGYRMADWEIELMKTTTAAEEATDATT